MSKKSDARLEKQLNNKRKEVDFDKDIAKFTERQMEVCAAVDSGMYKYLLYGGCLGGGKSYLLRWILVRLLMAWYFEKGLTWVQVMLACEDYPSLKDRQLTKIAREFPAWLGKGYSDHKDYGRCFILAPEYGNGVICFRNLDDSSKYQSAEFAAIGIDELTKNPFDTFNDLRMRLRWSGLNDNETLFFGGTNPGGIGHAFCKAFWIDGIFPPEYKEPTDYTKKFKFIQSKAEDNPYLDATYWNMLNTLPLHLRAAFRDGSWDTFIGQAFQEWNRHHHVIKSIPVPKDAPLFMTFDWGFGAPFSANWYWIDSDGRFYMFAEWYGWNGTPNQGLRLSDSEIAEGIKVREESMGFNTTDKTNNGIVFNPQITRFCDPTCFNKKPDYRGGGQGASTADEFRMKGIVLRPGDPARVLKWRQVHQRLHVPIEDGKVVGVPMMQIYDNCIHFIRTLSTLVVNPNNPEDIDSSGEDHCLSGDTLVITNNGEIKISDLVGTEGFVKTINDKWTKYYNCRKTQKNTDVIKIDFSNGRSVICTPDHKFMLLNKKWIKALDLSDKYCYISINNTRRQLCKSILSQILFKNLMEKNIIDVDNTSNTMAKGCIEQYMNFIMGKFLMDFIPIIKIKIKRITNQITLQLNQLKNICNYIVYYINYQMQNKIYLTPENLHLSGMEVMREENGIKNIMTMIVGKQLLREQKKYVNNVEKNLTGLIYPYTAQGNVNRKEHSLKVEEKNNFVKYVQNHFLQTVIKIKKLALHIVEVCLHGKLVKAINIQSFGKQDVYCLDVEDSSHSFYIEGGILVHNCADSFALLCMARPMQMKSWSKSLPEKESKKPIDISGIAHMELEEFYENQDKESYYGW